MRKVLIVAAAPIVALLLLSEISKAAMYQQLYKRFPDLDRKIIRRTYRKMLLQGLQGNLLMKQGTSDEEMDALFINMYNVEKFLAA